MWVADTDFVSPRRTGGPYQTGRPRHLRLFAPSPRLIRLIVSRLASRYGWTIQPEWLVFLPGWCRASTSPARPGANTGAASSPPSRSTPLPAGTGLQ